MSILPAFLVHWGLSSLDDVAAQSPLGSSSSASRLRNGTDIALEDAERKGFRFAIFGRTCIILIIGLFYLVKMPFPSGIYALAGAIGVALVGLISLLFVDTRYKRHVRFALFAVDAIVISALLAVIPLSRSGDVPQNVVFMTTRVQYYYILIATSILSLSPALVVWTGAWAIAGLGAATAKIVLEMDHIVTFQDWMPAAPGGVLLDTMLNPSFISLSFRVQEAIILAAVTAIAAWGVHRARNVVRAHAEVDAERQRVENLFGRYVPATILAELIKEGHLEPQMREATVLFIDIEGFTRIAETMCPAKLLTVINALFSMVTGVVDRKGGVVVNYVGDAIIASFNAPLPAARPARQAIEAARTVLQIASKRQFEGVSLHLRIGIATGPVAAGTVGSGKLQTYSLYGDAVNLAQRLEVMNKDFRTQCLICGTTARLVSAEHLEFMGLVPIRSRERPIEVFKLK